MARQTRPPLADISGAIQLLKEALPEDDPRSEVLDKVLRQVARLDRLVRDLLAFAQPLRPASHPFDLATLACEVADSCRPQARARGVHIDCRAPAPVLIEGDRPLLEAAVRHLLWNAIEAAPDGGNVRVECVSTPAGARLTVEDDGPGIPPDRLPLVFKPFFTTKSEGTGLGLSIAKRVVDAHGGMIHVEARPGGGTRATIELSKGGTKHGQR